MSKNLLDNGTVLTIGLVGAVAAIGVAAKRGVYGSRSTATSSVMERLMHQLNGHGSRFELEDDYLIVDDNANVSIVAVDSPLRPDAQGQYRPGESEAVEPTMVEVAKRKLDRSGNLVGLKVLGQFSAHDVDGIARAAKQGSRAVSVSSSDARISIPIKGRDDEFVVVKTSYDIGSPDSGRKRGYYMVVYPEKIERRSDGYTWRKTLAYSGYTKMIKPATRFSEKGLAEAISLAKSEMRDVIERVAQRNGFEVEYGSMNLGSRASMTRDDFRTSHLRGDARKLAEAIKKLVRDMNGEEPDGGGSVAFITPAQRRRMGWSPVKGTVMVLVFDGGDLAPYMNPNYGNKAKYNAMQDLIRRMGYWTEYESGVEASVYKRNP